MIELTNDQALEIRGGISKLISGTFLNSISRVITTLLDLGRSLGSSLRMLKSGKKCSV